MTTPSQLSAARAKLVEAAMRLPIRRGENIEGVPDGVDGVRRWITSVGSEGAEAIETQSALHDLDLAQREIRRIEAEQTTPLQAAREAVQVAAFADRGMKTAVLTLIDAEIDAARAKGQP